MARAATEPRFPAWAAITIAVIVVVAAAAIIWRTASGGPPSSAKAVQVRPGMYNLMEEARKGNVGTRHAPGR